MVKYDLNDITQIFSRSNYFNFYPRLKYSFNLSVIRKKIWRIDTLSFAIIVQNFINNRWRSNHQIKIKFTSKSLCGFLGMLHLEIITERIKREFNLDLVITTPSIIYEVLYNNGKRQSIYSPYFFPDDGEIKTVFEPWVKVKIITPAKYLGNIIQILFDHEAETGETENFGDNRSSISVKMPLRELYRNFFDELKSISSGYGSISYEINENREANVTRLDILVADEVVAALSKVISKKIVEEESENAVNKLEGLLPRQMFTLKIQAKAFGRIIASRTLSGMKKDVTQHMYGGDITRKMKLREKQKKGKKKMKERGRVNIPQDVFLKMMRGGNN